VLDGVYRRGTDGAPEFVEVPAPTDAALLLMLAGLGLVGFMARRRKQA
jgi:MYXO-CTERM domain-containing protein